MNFGETVRDHWLTVMLAACVTTAGLTWKVQDAVVVGPTKDALAQAKEYEDRALQYEDRAQRSEFRAVQEYQTCAASLTQCRAAIEPTPTPTPTPPPIQPEPPFREICSEMFSAGARYRTWHAGGGNQFTGDIIFDEITKCGPSSKRCFTARMAFENYDSGYDEAVGSWEKNRFRLLRTVRRDGPTVQAWEGECMEDLVKGDTGQVAIEIHYQ